MALIAPSAAYTLISISILRRRSSQETSAKSPVGFIIKFTLLYFIILWGCGHQCPSGYDSLTTLTQIPNTVGSCPKNQPARLCCPKGNEPQKCSWRGGGGTSCNAQCDVGEVVLALDETGDDGYPTCIQGYKAFCCSSGNPQPGSCFGACKYFAIPSTFPLTAVPPLACSASSCASPYVVQTHVKQGSADNGVSCQSFPNAVCPTICQSNTKPVCCDCEPSSSILFSQDWKPN